ncbi:hypothetical protein KEM48_011377 [Puccinia striiformis f. sp. tritici PST-130]|nr:hypothetical protein KEM48_011377 [Puccinia striiformis f. sp. tritici PST-130]
MAHHHSQRQQIDSLPPGTGTDSANIPPSFDPDLANPPSQPPTTVGDADSAKAAKSPPTTDPSIPSTPNEPSTPSTPSATPSTPTTPTTPTTDPSNPASSSSSAKPLPHHHLTNPHRLPHTLTTELSRAQQSFRCHLRSSGPTPISSASVASPSPSPVPSKHVDSSGSTQSDLPPPNQAVGGAISPSQIDQSIAWWTGSNVGTIMGVLVAAVIGALILVGVLGLIKRKRRERQSQAEFHQDILRIRIFENADESGWKAGFNGRPTDGIYGPRPPSIIERHQQQTSPPAPMPSYQPGQVVNYGYHPNQQQQQQQHTTSPTTVQFTSP